MLLRQRGRFGGTDCANKGLGPDFGAGREALRNTQIVFNLLCWWSDARVAGDDAAGREAAGAAVVCSMMALHAEDGQMRRKNGALSEARPRVTVH